MENWFFTDKHKKFFRDQNKIFFLERKKLLGFFSEIGSFNHLKSCFSEGKYNEFVLQVEKKIWVVV